MTNPELRERKRHEEILAALEAEYETLRAASAAGEPDASRRMRRSIRRADGEGFREVGLDTPEGREAVAWSQLREELERAVLADGMFDDVTEAAPIRDESAREVRPTGEGGASRSGSKDAPPEMVARRADGMRKALLGRARRDLRAEGFDVQEVRLPGWRRPVVLGSGAAGHVLAVAEPRIEFAEIARALIRIAEHSPRPSAVRLYVPEGPVRVEVDFRVGAKPDLRVVAVPLADVAPRDPPRAFDHHLRIRIYCDAASSRPESNE
jgi:hypothetical protein